MAEDFVIRIRADDAATATVKKIQAALGKITEPVEKSQKRLAQLGDMGQAGLGKLQKGFGGVANAARGVVDKIAEIVPGLTAISGAASLAGLSALAVKFGNFGFSLNKSSKLLGMNAQDLAAWHVAAKRAGVSADEFDSSMNSSQMAIRGAAYGANPQAMMMLNKMGVQIQRNRDGSIDYLKTQQQIMSALARQKSVEGQRDAANALGMGALLPMIQQGTWDADKAQAYRKGLVPTPAEIARAQQFHQDIGDLENSVSGLGNSIGSTLIPVLDPLVRGFSSWLDSHRVQIAQAIGDAVQKFATWLQSIDWDGVASKAGQFFDAIGGIKGVAIAIAAITFASPISGVLGLITQILRLTTVVIPGAMTALGTLGVAGLGAWAAFHSEDLNTGEDAYLKGHQAQPGQQWGGDAVGEQRAAANSPNAAVQDREKYLFARLKAAGYTDAQAAGQIGSLLQENGKLDPRKTNASGHAGIAQWGADRGGNFQKMFGHSVGQGTFGEQVDFYLWEMQNTERLADKRIRMAQTPEQAAEIQAREFERPGAAEANIERRQQNAAAVYASLTGADQPQQSPGDADQGGGADADRDARIAQMQQSAPLASSQATSVQHEVHVKFDNVPPGVRVDTKSSDGGYMPTRVNYAMNTDHGAIP